MREHAVQNDSEEIEVNPFFFSPQGELNIEGDRVMVARGGAGGNMHTAFEPNRGQTKHIRLDLKLIADVGLVG